METSEPESVRAQARVSDTAFVCLAGWDLAPCRQGAGRSAAATACAIDAQRDFRID